MAPILTAKNLTVGYRRGNETTAVLKGLNLQLEKGRLVALLGTNGIGKSTLLRTLAGAQPAIGGNVVIEGEDLRLIGRRKLSKLLGLVTTERTLAGGLTVRELVSLGRQPHTGFLGRLSDDDREIVEQSIVQAGIGNKAGCYMAELSDGERQKAMIAKALAQSTPIILLDEPTAFLDVASRIDTMRLLHQLAREQDKAILLSSHDVSQSIMLADDLWVVSYGGTLAAGATEDVILSGALQRMFANHDIKFDIALGDFAATLPATRKVAVSGTDAGVIHCVVNALRRNGIAAEVNPADAVECTVNVASAVSYEIRFENQPTRKVGSVSAVVEGLLVAFGDVVD